RRHTAAATSSKRYSRFRSAEVHSQKNRLDTAAGVWSHQTLVRSGEYEPRTMAREKHITSRPDDWPGGGSLEPGGHFSLLQHESSGVNSLGQRHFFQTGCGNRFSLDSAVLSKRRRLD